MSIISLYFQKHVFLYTNGNKDAVFRIQTAI